MKKETSLVGDLINFRGLVYSPINENGVIFLLGKVIEDLNMYIEEIKPGFPDCIGRRFTGRGWERVRIEFEFKSSHFKDHGHNPDECDIIVCWHNDWLDCPIEVIELKEEIASLPNRPVQRPSERNKDTEYTLEDLFDRKRVSEAAQNLFSEFDKRIRSLNEEIWSKIKKTTVAYYAPEKVFAYTYFRKNHILYDIFTGGKELQGVKPADPSKGWARWGTISLKNSADMPKLFKVFKESYARIRYAIKHNEPTGWIYKTEETDEGNTEITPAVGGEKH